jgi:phenylacetic acid degradation operon negative regulatory protein
MNRKEVSKKIQKVTDGILSSLVDLVLWNIFYFYQVGVSGSPGRVSRAEFLAYRDLQKFNYQSIKQAIYKMKNRRWVKDNLTLTKEGMKRLKSFFPIYFGERKWDGNWYLASYDIPEKRRKHRDILRINLKRLGFGEMHASLWICPFNFLEEVEKLVTEYNLSPFVILAVSNKVGREESKILANRIWNLDKINREYQNLIKKAQSKDLRDLIFEYLDILNRDPQLPKELLSSDWLGEKAYSMFRKYLRLFP